MSEPSFCQVYNPEKLGRKGFVRADRDSIIITADRSGVRASDMLFG
jgi:hypothetical protein